MPYVGKKPADIIATAVDTTTGTFSGVVDADAGITVDNITIDGTEIDLSSGDFTLDVAGDITLDADGGDVKISDGGTQAGTIGVSSSKLHIASVGNAGLRFRDDLNCITPCNADGSNSDADQNLGQSGVRFQTLFLSGGIRLGGTGTSNELSDYEEGTWTPAFLAASNPSVTYSIQTGHYTKIGQMVYVNMRIATNGVSGGSGTVRIGGLPFSSNSTSSLISVGAVVANSWTGEHPMKFRIINNGTDIYLYYRASLTANDLDNNSNVTDLTTASGGHNVTEITATYFTSA